MSLDSEGRSLAKASDLAIVPPGPQPMKHRTAPEHRPVCEARFNRPSPPHPAAVDDEDLAGELEGFTPAMDYPLVNPDLITNAVVAQTLLTLYAKNRVR